MLGLISVGTETAPGFSGTTAIQNQVEHAILQSLQIRTFIKVKVNYQRCEMSAHESMLSPEWISGDKVTFALLLFNCHHSEPWPFSFCIRAPTQRLSALQLLHITSHLTLICLNSPCTNKTSEDCFSPHVMVHFVTKWNALEKTICREFSLSCTCSDTFGVNCCKTSPSA